MPRLGIVRPINNDRVYNAACRLLINRAYRLTLKYMYRPIQLVGVRVGNTDKGISLMYRTVTRKNDLYSICTELSTTTNIHPGIWLQM